MTESGSISVAQRKPLAQDQPVATTLPRAIWLVWLEVLVLSLCSLVFYEVERWRGYPPRLFPLLSPRESRFGDFTIYIAKFQQLFHTERFFHEFFPFTYPAPVGLVYEFFVRVFPRHPTVAFLGFCIAALGLPWVPVMLVLCRRGMPAPQAIGFTVTLLVCSWPAMLIVDRANMEVCVWVAMVAAAWAFLRAHLKIAAVFFGLAGALKLFPIILLGLFISMRRWRELWLGMLSFVVISVVSLAMLGPTIPAAYEGISRGLTFFKVGYMQMWSPWETGVDHSLFALIKCVLIWFFHHPRDTAFPTALSVYLGASAVGGCLLYVLRIRFLPLLNQWLILCIASIYFTAFSGDGTLVHLYYPFVFLVLVAFEAHRQGSRVPGLAAALYLIGFLVSCETFFLHKGLRLEGQVKAVALGVLLWVALRYRFPAFPWMTPDQEALEPAALRGPPGVRAVSG